MPTLKESPADAQIVSHVYMVRGGFIRKVAAGIYNFLPLGWRVIQKIEAIVRDELNKTGAQEIRMPASIPAELWKESGRWKKYGPELLRFNDRKGADFCFGPTHEEVVVDIIRGEIKSYRDLPRNLYQIQTKFRDEMRPRAGLMRGREFIMKDAYSFHTDEAQAMVEYQHMFDAYTAIFSRCGLKFRAVEADSGSIGGSKNHEFQVLAESGEDDIVACSLCDYAANVEEAGIRKHTKPAIVGESQKKEVATPDQKTIDDVAAFLKVPKDHVIKSLVYMADEKPVCVLVRGDRVVNEVKLKKLLDATELFLAREGQVKEAIGVGRGSVGPVGLSIDVFADDELEGATGAVVGANKEGVHLVGVDLARDASIKEFSPLRMAQNGDGCPRCEGVFQTYKGIEVGHVFFLGNTYSKPMKCTYLDKDGAEQPMEMGCYGIGLTRTAAAAIEQNHDENGIIWPMTIAPYEVAILPLQDDEGVKQAAEDLYKTLGESGVDVVLDDRNERAGAKFKDADLIGVPLRIAIGKRSLKEGNLELKWRRDKDASMLPIEGAAQKIIELVHQEKLRVNEGQQ